MRIIRISSESGSDDDIPLRVLKNGHPEDPNSYTSLCRQSLEACEFCDKISNNRYLSLIHNVKHIIIPLLNQTVVQCKTCLHHFTSQEDLKIHIIKKHHNVMVHIDLTKTEPTYFGTQNAGTWEPTYFGTWNAGPRTVQSNKFEIQPFSRPNNEVHILENASEKSDSTNVSIKNRLLFEDDLTIDCDRLLNDLTTDCKVNLEVFDTPWLNKEFSVKSVHYDDLVKPGVYRCKKCGKGFPLRYDAIIHETSHLKLRNSQISYCMVCNEYIEGDVIKLKRHYLNYHKEKYKEVKETVSDHELYKKNNVNVTHEKVDVDDKYVSKIINLCEFCYSFSKNRTSMNYEFIDTMSELGKRYKCEQCRSSFFEIHRIKRRVQKNFFKRKKKKIMSNEDRLKIIKNRFKMLKQ